MWEVWIVWPPCIECMVEDHRYHPKKPRITVDKAHEMVSLKGVWNWNHPEEVAGAYSLVQNEHGRMVWSLTLRDYAAQVFAKNVGVGSYAYGFVLREFLKEADSDCVKRWATQNAN